MPIHFVPGPSRALDSESGEYLVAKFIHYQSPTWNCLLYAGDGRLLINSSVKQDAIDLSGDGKRGLFKLDIVRIEKFANDGSSSLQADPHSADAQKLVRFLEVFLVDHSGRDASVEIEFHLDIGAMD